MYIHAGFSFGTEQTPRRDRVPFRPKILPHQKNHWLCQWFFAIPGQCPRIPPTRTGRIGAWAHPPGKTAVPRPARHGPAGHGPLCSPRIRGSALSSGTIRLMKNARGRCAVRNINAAVPRRQSPPLHSKRRRAGMRRSSASPGSKRRRAPVPWTFRSPSRRSHPCPSGHPP